MGPYAPKRLIHCYSAYVTRNGDTQRLCPHCVGSGGHAVRRPSPEHRDPRHIGLCNHRTDFEPTCHRPYIPVSFRFPHRWHESHNSPEIALLRHHTGCRTSTRFTLSVCSLHPPSVADRGRSTSHLGYLRHSSSMWRTKLCL